MKRSDNWSKRLLGSNSVVTTAIDNTILDKIRREYIALKNLDIKNFCSDDYARTGRAIKILVGKAKGNDQLVIEALRWAKEQKWCDWTLETVSRRWVDFMAYKENKPRSRPL